MFDNVQIKIYNLQVRPEQFTGQTGKLQKYQLVEIELS